MARVKAGLLALPLLLLPQTVAATSYGPDREDCSSTGVIVAPSSNWREQIKRAEPGTTILMRGGIYRYKGALTLPSGTSDRPITIKPYDCEAVELRPEATSLGVGQALNAGSYVTLAGIDIETSSHASFLNISSGSNFVLRNNRFRGARNDAFVIRGGEQLRFVGNSINSGPTPRAAMSKSSGGHIFYLKTKGASSARDVRIEENLIEGSYFGDVAKGDDVFAVAAGDRIVIEHNLIENQYNIENILDIKTSSASIPVIFRDNTVRNNYQGSKGGQDKGRPEACIVIGDDNPGSRLQHVITGNDFSGCPAGFFSVGAGKRSGSARITHNTFRDDSKNNLPGALAQAIRTEVKNNEFFGGAVKIGSGGCGSKSMPAGLVIRKNTFHGTVIYDQAYKCGARPSLQSENTIYR